MGITGGGIAGGLISFGLGTILGLYAESKNQDVEEGAPHNTEFTTAQQGSPIYDVLGLTKVAGNIIWKKPGTNVQDTGGSLAGKKKGGGKGGGEKSQSTGDATGKQFKHSWAVAICQGPIDRIFTIFQEEQMVWEGNTARSGDYTTFTLDGMGTMRLYWGTSTQGQDSLMSGTTHPAYKNLCYAVFDDCNCGGFDRIPNMRFSFAKQPEYSAVCPVTQKINYYDYNPVAAIYHLLTNQLGLPTSYIHEASFQVASEILRGEVLGISAVFDRHKEAQAYLMDILDHIGGALRYGPDGKFHLFLMREGDDASELTSVNEDMLLDDLSIERKSWAAVVNEVKINHPLRQCMKTTEDASGLDGSPGVECTANGGATISYSTTTMTTGATQTLSSSDGEIYEWSLRTGNGSLSADWGASTVFTAGSGCGAVIDMLCCGRVVDTVTIGVDVGGIVYSTNGMQTGATQVLSSSDGADYYWRIYTGGGELSTAYGSSVTLTAPASNPDCAYDATVEMYCFSVSSNEEIIIGTVNISYNDYSNTADTAYDECECYARLHQTGSYVASYSTQHVNCLGDDLSSSSGETGGGGWTEEEAQQWCSDNYACSGGEGDIAIIDQRLAAMKAAGCCPGALWGM
jgi:hypothetical protein